MNGSIWLSISLFCSKSKTHLVLSEGIRPFIMDRIEKNLVSSWYIEFNTSSGSNIRLALLVPEQQASKLSIYSKQYFISFFEKSDFQLTPLNLPLLNDIFLPFPENSIQFGLFDASIASKKTSMDFLQKNSEIIMEAISEDEIDEDTILTLCIYLHLFLKDKVLNVYPSKEQILKSFYEAKKADSSNIELSASFPEEVKKYQDVVTIVYNHIRDPHFYKDNLWLNIWDNLCALAIDNEDFLDAVDNLMYSLNQQLNTPTIYDRLISDLVLSTWEN